MRGGYYKKTRKCRWESRHSIASGGVGMCKKHPWFRLFPGAIPVFICLLFLCQTTPLPADPAPLSLTAGTRIPVRTILNDFNSHNDTQVILAGDIQAAIEVRADMQISLDQLINQVLPVNGFYTYRSSEAGKVVVSRDLVDRYIPISREVNRGLRRAAAGILGSTNSITFNQALERVLFRDDLDKDLVVVWPERSLRLTANPSALSLHDTRTRAVQIQESLNRLGRELANTPPVPLETEVIQLAHTTGQPFINQLNENLFGGTGFDGHSWDGTPYLAQDDNAHVLVIGHTRPGIARARALAGLPAFKVTEPKLELVSRSYQTVPERIRRDLSIPAAHQRAQRVDAVVKLLEAMLYETGGKEEAAARGRVLIPHPEEGTIDVIDTPGNLQKIDEYLRYQGVSLARNVELHGKPSWPQIRVIQVQHRAIDQAARAFRRD